MWINRSKVTSDNSFWINFSVELKKSHWNFVKLQLKFIVKLLNYVNTKNPTKKNKKRNLPFINIKYYDFLLWQLFFQTSQNGHYMGHIGISAFQNHPRTLQNHARHLKFPLEPSETSFNLFWSRFPKTTERF